MATRTPVINTSLVLEPWGAAGGGTPALKTYTVADSQWSNNQLAIPALGGARRNTFASFTVSVPASATVFNVRGVCDLERVASGINGALGAFVTDSGGNTTFQKLTIPAGSTITKVGVTLPTGSRTVRIMTQDIARVTPSTNTVAGTVFLNFETDATPTISAVSAPALRVLGIGDSISGGGGTTNQFQQTWSRVLDDLLGEGSGVTVDQVSGGSLVELYGTGSYVNRPATLARLLSQQDGTGSNIAAILLGTNDCGRNTSDAGTFGTNYAALVDDLHAARPSLRILCITPTKVKTYEASLENYRQQIRYVAAARNWIQLLEGPDAMTGDPTSDYVHPGPAQHAEIAAYVLREINRTSSGTGEQAAAGPSFKNAEFTGGTVSDPNAGWVPTGTGVALAANGVTSFSGASGAQLVQNVKMERGKSYRLRFKNNSISGGYVSLQSDSGQNGQIHPALQGAGTGGGAVEYTTEFVCLNSNETYYLRGNDNCTAVVEYCILEAIADLPIVVQNFDFLSPLASTAAAGWLGTNASISNGIVSFTNAPAGSKLQQTTLSNLIVGQNYRVFGLLTNLTGGTVQFSGTQFSSFRIYGGGTLSTIFTATATTEYITITPDTGVTTSLDYFIILPLGSTGAAPTTILKNPEFDQSAVSDQSQGWLAGSNVTIGSEVATYTNANGVAPQDQLSQSITNLTPGSPYRASYKINTISSGYVALQTDSGQNGQIHPLIQGAGTGGSATVYSVDFTAASASELYFLRGYDNTDAVVEYCRIIAL